MCGEVYLAGLYIDWRYAPTDWLWRLTLLMKDLYCRFASQPTAF